MLYFVSAWDFYHHLCIIKFIRNNEQQPHSVTTVERYRIGDVALLLLPFEVLLSVTHFEEVVVFSAAVLIVAILAEETSLLLRPLDVPEVMSRNRLEDLLLL